MLAAKRPLNRIVKGPMDSPVMADFAANLGREGSMRD
jgi:hypothetical protein